MIGGRRDDDPLDEDLAVLDNLQDEVRRPVRRPTSLIVPIMITMIVMTGGVTIAWYSYNAGVKEGSEGAAPLLKPSGPMKVAPDNPGGTQIPHQDVTIYQSLTGKEGDSKVERILPPPERPKLPPAATPAPEDGQDGNSRVRAADSVPGQAPSVAQQTTPGTPSARALVPPSSPPTAQNPPSDQQLALESAPTTPSAPKPAAPAPTQDVTAAPVKPVPPPQPTIPETKAPEAKAPETRVAAIPAGAYRVQIGSVSSEAQAERLWDTQRGKSAGLLASLSMNVEKKVIKGKAYYRVQAGPLKDAASARTLCDKLKQRQIGCFVVHPKP